MAAAVFGQSCDDDLSGIGSSITSGDVKIFVDSLEYNLHSVSVENKTFDTRSGTMMIGNLNVPEYGSLSCSFVTRLMCLQSLAADTVPQERIDSCKIRLGMLRQNLTGDSLAPQQVTVYKLTRQLPSDISNDFNPEGYYDKNAPISRKNYTVSAISMPDTTLKKNKPIFIDIDAPKEMAREVFSLYKTRPEIFRWPQTFAEYFPGLYVASTFGNGCVANLSQVYFFAYYHNPVTTTSKDSTGNVTTTVKNVRDSVCLFTTAPEVLSSNNISYKVSQKLRDLVASGKTVITTPGGYTTRFRFPADEIIRDYEGKDHNLSIISSLTMSIPADTVANNYGITVAPYLLMVKTSEMEEFFAKNKLPDNKTSFYATYDTKNKYYRFTGMREYLLSLIKKGDITDDDVDFTLVPVSLSYETNKSPYYSQGQSYLRKCVPFIVRPTMTVLDTEKTFIVFSFSSQVIE